jgi:hypothetical protein
MPMTFWIPASRIHWDKLRRNCTREPITDIILGEHRQ